MEKEKKKKKEKEKEKEKKKEKEKEKEKNLPKFFLIFRIIACSLRAFFSQFFSIQPSLSSK